MVNLFTIFALDSCKNSFLGLLPWNYYLDADPSQSCTITNFHLLGGDSSLLLIALAIVDDLFRIAGMLAVAFIIFAGTKFILSGGSPDEAAKARTAATNAVIGLGISLVAIAFISFLGAQFGTGIGQSKTGGLDVRSLPNPAGAATGDVLQTVLSITFGVLGAISFLVVVIAGMQYTLSQGDPQATAQSKNMIIYALIGLVLAIVAESAVSFVLNFHP